MKAKASSMLCLFLEEAWYKQLPILCCPCTREMGIANLLCKMGIPTKRMPLKRSHKKIPAVLRILSPRFEESLSQMSKQSSSTANEMNNAETQTQLNRDSEIIEITCCWWKHL